MEYSSLYSVATRAEPVEIGVSINIQHVEVIVFRDQGIHGAMTDASVEAQIHAEDQQSKEQSAQRDEGKVFIHGE